MRTIVFFFLVFGISGCSLARRKYSYQLCVEKPADASVLTKNELKGTADTKFASVSGKAIENSTSEPVVSVIVTFRDPASGNVFSLNTNFDGGFSINLPPAMYVLSISTPDFAEFSQEIVIQSGEIRNLEILLGDLRSFVTYEIKSRKKMSEEDLKRAEQELRGN